MGTARLPIPGKDEGRWGDILNEYLLVAHTEDGSLRSNAPTAGVVDEAYVTNAIQGKVNRSELAEIATSGSYDDLANKPDFVASNDARLTNTRVPSDGSVTTSKLADGSITEPKLAANNTPNSGDVLTWSGVAFSWQVPESAPVQSVNGRTGAVTVTKADLSLDNVNNTSDANKPVSNATQAALDLKADATDARFTDTRTPTDNTVATAKLQDASVTEPKLAISNAPTNGDFLAWDGSQLTWQTQAASPVQSVSGRTGAVTLTSTDVGLGNVNNTSDANKPVSAAMQTALNAKADASSLSAVATSGDYADLTGRPTFPSAGTTSGTYAAGNDSRIVGALQTSTYTTKGDLLAATGSGAVNRLAIGTDGQVLSADSSQSTGVRWTTPASAPVSSVAGRTGAVTLTSTDVGLGNVNNTSDANKPVSTATQTALNAKVDTSSLAAVATSGSYADLSNKPTIPSAGAGITNTSGVLSVNYGTTASTAAAGNDARITGALQSTIATTKGDILAATGSGSFNRVGIGTDGQVLTADSSQSTGVRWTTVAASGGAGITRSIVSVSTNLTAAAAAATDYVYILTGNYTLTLPTAVGNTNKYVVKNRHTSSVALAFNGSETADGGGITLSANSSVDLVSDGSNWVII